MMSASALTGSYGPLLLARLLLLIRLLATGLLAGLGAGLIAGGVGSRLAMKVIALTAGRIALGQTTENGNIVGAFTGETIGLIIFGAFAGTPGGLLYVALRPWLPYSARWRGLAFGAILLASAGTLLLTTTNFDFTRFGIPALNVALFALLFILFGLLVAPLADWLDRRLPTLAPAPGADLLAAILFSLALLGALIITLSGLLGPLGLITLLLIVAALVALTIRLARTGGIARARQLGGYLIISASGLLGLLLLLALIVSTIANDSQQRLTNIGLALLLLGGLGVQFLGTSDSAPRLYQRAAPLLALPLLAGLVITLREIVLLLT